MNTVPQWDVEPRGKDPILFSSTEHFRVNYDVIFVTLYLLPLQISAFE